MKTSKSQILLRQCALLVLRYLNKKFPLRVGIVRGLKAADDVWSDAGGPLDPVLAEFAQAAFEFGKTLSEAGGWQILKKGGTYRAKNFGRTPKEVARRCHIFFSP